MRVFHSAATGSQTPRRAFWALLCGLLLVAAIIGLQENQPPASALENTSQLIWSLPQRGTVLGYDWLSQTQVIYVTRTHGTSEVWVLDIRTRASTIVQEATAQLKRFRIDGGSSTDIQLSADRSRLLLAENRDKSASLFVLDLRDWTTLRTPLSRSDGPVCWFGGGEGVAQFVRLGRGCEARVFDLKSNSLRRVQLPFAVAYPVAYCPADACFVSTRIKGGAMEVSRIQLSPTGALLGKTEIRVAQGGFEESPAFSPDGGKLAWVRFSPRKVLRPELKPGFPFLSFCRPWVRTLRVADVATEKMRIVGTSTEEVGISDLRWTPDSSNLSFLSHGKLYLVSLDQRPALGMAGQHPAAQTSAQPFPREADSAGQGR